jgi:glycosyltransferase involved in cell wall biosynthesis
MTELGHSEPAGRGQAMPAGQGLTAIVVKGYPRLSETFIAQEILGLQQLGQRQLIVSLRHPTDKLVHDLNRRITAPVLYLPEYLYQEPARVAEARDWARGRPGYAAAYAAFRRDFRRDPTPNRWRRFGQACVLARELPPETNWIYVHYLHTPASVGRYAALIRGLPWSVSAHAKDIWTTPEWELREKLAEARWAATCTAVNHAYLTELAPETGRVTLVHHGLDFARFPDPIARARRDGRDRTDPVRLISVGRAVEKKGFDRLLDAFAALPPALAWHWTHIGGGEKLAGLKAQAARLGLAERIEWRGALAQDAVVAALLEADLFVLTARIAEDGDRDGLPNVLMEAQATGLCCLASAVSAIPELIRNGETGVLVPPDDVPAARSALAELIADPARRARLGAAGAARVRRDFGFAIGLAKLARRFGLPAPATGQG